MAAEMTTAADQLAGGYTGSSDYMWFQNSTITSNNVVYPFTGTLANNATNWFAGLTGDLSGYSLKVWDKSCPH
jgi:hypothetical protein